MSAERRAPFPRDRSGPRVSWVWALLAVALGTALMGYAIYRLIVP